MLASAAPSISTPSAGFELGEVDTPPRLTRPVRPVYPYTARRKGITGVVTVRFLVDAAGNVSRPVIVRAEPQGVFEAAVLDAVARWRFHPGVYQGSAVPTWVEVPLRFDLDS
nr:energy transducer TonB [Desulfobaculum xiamenense]